MSAVCVAEAVGVSMYCKDVCISCHSGLHGLAQYKGVVSSICYVVDVICAIDCRVLSERV